MTYHVRRAVPDDLEQLHNLVNARVEWLRGRGSKQWSTRNQYPLIADAVEAGDTWLMLDGADVVATVNVTTVGDADFWTATELTQPALYLSKLATHPSRKGDGLGRLLIEWINGYAVSWGIPRLRGDVWRNNTELHNYYQRSGFPLVRVANVPGRWSGSLFESCYRPVADLTNDVTAETSRAISTALDSELQHPLDVGEPPDPLATVPDHWHQLSGIHVTPAGSPNNEPRPLNVSGECGQPLLIFNSGAGWRTGAAWPRPIASWAPQPNLQAGRLYAISHQHTNDGCAVVLVAEHGMARNQLRNGVP